MQIKSIVSRVGPAFRRGVAVVLVGVVLSAVVLPTTTAAQTPGEITLDRPMDGVGDSPLVP